MDKKQVKIGVNNVYVSPSGLLLMDRIEFYKMSIEEYPKHKDFHTLCFCINEIQQEADALYRWINHLEDNGGEDVQIREMIKDYDCLSETLRLAKTYRNNPKSCKSCINYNVIGALGGAYCSIVRDSVLSPDDMYKHPNCPVVQ